MTLPRRQVWVAMGLLGLVLGSHGSASAQEGFDQLLGQRVRATIEGASREVRISGILMNSDDASLVIDDDGRTIDIPSSDLLQMEASRGRSSGQGAKKGALIGSVAGFLGLTAWLNWRYLDDQYNLMFGAIVGAPVGALLGAGVGSSIGGEQWVTVWVAPAPGGSFQAGFRVVPSTLLGLFHR